ncbi:MAG: UDP-N-acetylmuramoyl-tripeptide--D-alanyl-D-alanine ligase [Gemmatimonadetes bacterium]|nr:UDP-N-acetylmuramoyl-tripeptide--D-alanyl-D-alanine ligase [Gemmatimonadota bacterium]
MSGGGAAAKRSVGPTFTWTDAHVREALGLRSDPARADRRYRSVSSDSRSIEEGDLFVALSGPRFEGHDFVADAVASGARGVVVSRPVSETGPAVLYPVLDTLVALGRLARHRRDALPAAVVGIAGSAGKTSTKELAAAALGAGRRVYATRANDNNRIGVPQTLLAAPADREAVVVEMGTSERGEMAALTEIAAPDVALLVTVGEEHLEGLGTRDDAVEEELDLLRGLGAGARAIVGDTPADLPERARALVPAARVAGWSDRADDDLRPRDVAVDVWGYHSFAWQGARVQLRMAGRHAVVNALLALAAAEELGVDAASAAAALGDVEPRGMRGEIRHVGRLGVIVDCYNANPQSVRVALDLLEARAPGTRKVAVLGSMLELGARSEALHREVLEHALARDIDVLLATGAFAVAAAGRRPERPRLLAEADPRAAYALLREHLEGDETVLLKGSRGVALERLLPLLDLDFGAAGEG